jgi:hypothetical protein
VKRGHVFRLEGFRGVQARGWKREFFVIAVKMRVAVAGVRRDFKISIDFSRMARASPIWLNGLSSIWQFFKLARTHWSEQW